MHGPYDLESMLICKVWWAQWGGGGGGGGGQPEIHPDAVTITVTMAAQNNLQPEAYIPSSRKYKKGQTQSPFCFSCLGTFRQSPAGWCGQSAKG